MDNSASIEENDPIIERLLKEIDEDLKMDDVTIRDKCLKLVSRKHYYVGILIRKKQEILKLEEKRAEIISKLSDKIRGEMLVGGVSDAQVTKKAVSSDLVSRIDARIKSNKLVVELLEMTSKNFSEQVYMTKSIVELMKMEES